MVAYGNVVAGTNLTYHDYLALTSALPDASLSDESEIVDELRRIKSPEEIAMLEKSGAIARTAVDAMIEAAAPGVRENELYAAMLHAQIVAGGEPNIFNLLSITAYWQMVAKGAIILIAVYLGYRQAR